MSIEWVIDLDLDRVSEAATTAAPIGAGKAMEHIRGVSAALTPEDTGHLVGTGDVQVDGNDASLTYDGPYARYLHEGLVRHVVDGTTTYEGALHFEKPTAQAKFLEQPMNTERDTALGIVAKEIREAL